MPNYKKKIRRAARRYGVRPELLVAQLRQESGLKMGLTSPAGAQDIAQFMPETAKQYGVTLGDGRAADDIDGAARLMRDMLKKYGGSEKKALAAYNAGPGNVDKYGGVPPFSETQNYVKTILANAGDPKPGSSNPGVRSQRSQATYETTPAVDNSGLRQQFLQSYLTERGKPNALLDLKTGLDSAQDTPAKRVKLSGPGGSVRTNPGASVPAGRSPTGGKGKVIGTPYSGTHTLGNWQSDNAVDISVKEGTKIRSTGTGKVVKVSGGYSGGSSRFDGYQVTIETPNGSRFYTHLKKVSVKPGQKIKRGQVLGRSGSANGVPHLHFGVEEGDPRRFT